jgi:myo-inositol-1(or 4)-monophosphatase
MPRVDVAIEAARSAGAVLRRVQHADLSVEEKQSSRTSIVTAADLQSQQEIVRVIRRACPDDLIIGEEGNDGVLQTPGRWYVDPLDGTTNYAHGLPFCCTSIAYCDDGGTGIGVVHDPLRDEMFVAVREQGATCNGHPIGASVRRDLHSSVLSTQVQSDDRAVLDRYASRLRCLLGVARAVRTLGAPALALAYVACGRLDAFCEDNMSPWDTLAGALLIEEAGGRVTTFDGAARPLDGRADILASNGHLHERLVGLLQERPAVTAFERSAAS